MSCTTTPLTTTTTEDLVQQRSTLEQLRSGVEHAARQRAAYSSNMATSPGITPVDVHRGTKLTLPLVFGKKAASLDSANNTLVYKVAANDIVTLAEHSPIEHARISADARSVFLYGRPVTEGDSVVRYAAVLQAKGTTFSAQSEAATTTPPVLVQPDMPASAQLPSVSAVKTDVTAAEATIIASFYKLLGEAATYVQHTVAKSGWVVAEGTTPEKALLQEMPTSSNDAYPINERAPYGPYFKTVRPPGYRPEWPRVCTDAYGSQLVEDNLEFAVETCNSTLGLNIWDGLRHALVNGSLITIRNESGGKAFIPTFCFEIRPLVGTKPTPVNIIDVGPPRTTPKGKTITTPYRSDGKYFSAGGIYQYTRETWESLAKRYSQMFGVTTGMMWLWEAPIEAQVWYQAAYITQNFHTYTQGLPAGLNFPAFYYAIMVHCNNIGPALTSKFLRDARRAIIQDATRPGYTYIDAHRTCKRVYEQKAWLVKTKHSAYINRIARTLQRELPKLAPQYYPTDPSLYPVPL